MDRAREVEVERVEDVGATLIDIQRPKGIDGGVG